MAWHGMQYLHCVYTSFLLVFSLCSLHSTGTKCVHQKVIARILKRSIFFFAAVLLLLHSVCVWVSMWVHSTLAYPFVHSAIKTFSVPKLGLIKKWKSSVTQQQVCLVINCPVWYALFIAYTKLMYTLCVWGHALLGKLRRSYFIKGNSTTRHARNGVQRSAAILWSNELVRLYQW